MLRMPPPQTFPPETLSLDELVPQNHLVDHPVFGYPIQYT